MKNLVGIVEEVRMKGGEGNDEGSQKEDGGDFEGGVGDDGGCSRSKEEKIS